MIELYIDGLAVDIAPDTKITLNFESNLFGDISKISASNSFTIALPKTPKNSGIFGAPAVIGGMSNAPYRKWSAQLFVNGVSMIDTAYAILLSVADSYDIALYWGVVTALQSLKEGGKSIADLSEVLQIKYGGANWWNNWNSKTDETGNLVNALYECGIDDLRNNATARGEVALLPSVKASWLWNGIVADNGLKIKTPSEMNTWLNRVAIPFVGHKVETQKLLKYVPKRFSYISRGEEAVVMLYGGEAQVDAPFTLSPKAITMRLDGRKYSNATVALQAGADGEVKGMARLSMDAFTVTGRAELCFAHYSDGELVEEVKGQRDSGRFIDLSVSFNKTIASGDYIALYARLYKHTGFDKSNKEQAVLTQFDLTFECSTKGAVEQEMGGVINTRDNLPDIKQIDFVKAIMAMRGYWATLIDGEIHIQSVADFYKGAHETLDWSHKLIGSGDGDAQMTSYTLADYAQRNIMRYKEDDTVKIDANGVLFVENDNLDKEKDMVTLPFSASDGSAIPHLSYEDGKVKETKVQPRIMELDGKFSIDSIMYNLKFGSLSFSQLISANYKYWQRIIRNPIVIEEQMNLSEIDIKELDYRKPIYLQKYGARFAVQKVQWREGDASVVTLVYLPPMAEIAVALPYNVTTGVTFGASMDGVIEPYPSWAYLVSGEGDYFAEKATLRFDDAKAKALGIGFNAWISESGIVLSTDNPFVYDGSNGDMVIYANTADTLS